MGSMSEAPLARDKPLGASIREPGAPYDDEGGWDGRGQDELDLDSVPDEEGFAEHLDIDPQDEAPTPSTAPDAEASAPPRVRQVRRQPLDESGAEAPEQPIQAAKDSLASVNSLLAIHAIGKTQGAAARFEAYLAHCLPEDRERIYMVMLENGWKQHDPEIVVMALMGHLVAIGRTIPAAIDAKILDFEQRVTSALAETREVPELIDQALAGARELAKELVLSQRAEGEDFSAHLGDALRSTIQDVFDQVDQEAGKSLDGLKKELTKETALHKVTLDDLTKNALGQLGGMSLKVAREISDMVKLREDQKVQADHAHGYWRIAAIGMACFIAGACAVKFLF